MSKSFADVMASENNGRRRATETICLSPDLGEQYQAHVIAAAAAKAEDDRRDPESPSNRRSADLPKWRAELEAAQALVEANPTSFYEAILEALPRAEWLRLRTAHMPREGHPEDADRYNSDTFPEAAVIACLVDPVPSDDVAEYLRANLATGEWNRLATVCWNLNEGARQIPKADQLSEILGGSGSN